MATILAGYDIGSVPRFEATSAAAYGRLTLAKRGFYKGVTRVKVMEKKTKLNKPSTSVLLLKPRCEMQFSLSTWPLARAGWNIEMTRESDFNVLSVGHDQVLFPNLE